ncbi:hypothetical protein [Paenibacillus glycinis]|uniref:Antigen I/II N-terminal domain-containing protein n=1 Tax=Paenibacillus glycinis TaxID=2697035 RepID=A0ABW9XT11_9BACL|nr:hypothetical protein [Paenibacillus glycinis]NBD25671.1 hypothetical protein [Paenibacillus glycinis]
MKKAITAFALGAVLLAGCSNAASNDKAANEAAANVQPADAPAENDANQADAAGTEEAVGDEQQIEVDKGLLNAEVTLPASFFEGEDQTSESIIADAKSKGVKDVTKNADGSYTYKMSKSVYNDMLKDAEKSVLDYAATLTDGQTFKSIRSVDHNKSLSEFTLTVDKAAFEGGFDGFAGLSLGMSAMMYQAFNGTAPDKYKVTINYKDAGTKEVFDTVVYPDALKDLQASE